MCLQPLAAVELRRWALNKIVNAEIALQQQGSLADVARQTREQHIRSAVAEFDACKHTEELSSEDVEQALGAFHSYIIVDVSSLPDSALCLPDKCVMPSQTSFTFPKPLFSSHRHTHTDTQTHRHRHTGTQTHTHTQTHS